jgi:hypothetical protein
MLVMLIGCDVCSSAGSPAAWHHAVLRERKQLLTRQALHVMCCKWLGSMEVTAAAHTWLLLAAICRFCNQRCYSLLLQRTVLCDSAAGGLSRTSATPKLQKKQRQHPLGCFSPTA